MDRIVEKSLLFDFYGELLTQHQKEVYGEYIQNDLSPTEIAVLRGISRQGAYDLIKRCEKILTDYENPSSCRTFSESKEDSSFHSYLCRRDCGM